jgi:NADPH:quinone reductase-like Zn-dependent oxidoreductase
MRQVWITKAGAPEVLEVREAPDPVVKKGEIRIRTKCAGINFADLSARQGMYPDAPKIPCVVGYEVSGVVDQVGDDAPFKVGERVFGMPRFGGYSDTVVLPAAQAFRLPEKMTFEEAAALPVAYLTAHHMMLYLGTLRPGMRVLIHSAAGGVGMAAIDLARAHGCIMYGTASPSKHELLRERGCQHPLDSSRDVVTQVREQLEREGAVGLDLVLDPVGGRSWTEGYKLLQPSGRLVAFGVSSMTQGKSRNLIAALGTLMSMKWWNPITLMNDNKTISGVNMGHLFDRLDLLRPQFEALLALYERGEVRPFVDRTFRFDEAAAAHHYLHDRKAKGKVLLVP